MKTIKILQFPTMILLATSSFGQNYSEIKVSDPKEYVIEKVHLTDSLYTPQQKQMILNDYYGTKRDSLINNVDSAFSALPGLWFNEYEWKLVLLYYGATDTTLLNTKLKSKSWLDPTERNSKVRNLPFEYSKISHVLSMYDKLGFPDREEVRLTGNDEKLRYKPKVKTDKAALEEYNRHMKLQEEFFINRTF